MDEEVNKEDITQVVIDINSIKYAKYITFSFNE